MAEEEEKKQGPLQCPEGAAPVEILQSKTLEKFNLKNGEGLLDVVPYAKVNVQELKNDLNMMGKMSDFADLSDQIQALEVEEVLLWSDKDEKFGKNWVMCFTAEAEDALLFEEREKERQEAEARRLAAEAEEQRLAEEEAARNVVYRDVPLVPRPYASDFAQDTMDEVALLTPAPRRPRLALTVGRARASTKKAPRFGPRDAEQGGGVDLRSHKEPVFFEGGAESVTREKSIGLQCGARTAEAGAQTTWFQKANKAVQYASLTTEAVATAAAAAPGGPAAAAGAQHSVGVGVGTDADGEPGPPPSPGAEARRMEAFFRRAVPAVERALRQNETVDVFRNIFKVAHDEDTALSKHSENELREVRTFSDIRYSKNKVLSAIDWVPRRKGMVAVAAVEALGFDARCRQAANRAAAAHVLLWDFADLMRPACKLRSPHEVFCFRFNPGAPDVVAAGTLSGQVALWDVGEAMAVLTNKKNRSLKRARRASGGGAVPAKGAGAAGGGDAAAPGGGGDGGGEAAAAAAREDEEERAKALETLEPVALSHIDTSHKRPVADLAWLPPELHVNFRGRLLRGDHVPKRPYQFVTVAGDGMLLFWDTRFQEIAEGKLTHVAKPRHTDAKPGKDGQVPRAPWVPLFRVGLKRPEGVGELSLARVAVDLRRTALVAGAAAGEEEGKKDPAEDDDDDYDPADELRSKVFVATEEGDIVFADWRAKSMAAANATGAVTKEGEDDDGDPGSDFVQWMERDHPRPCVALQRSPFFPDMVLSVGDWNFQLWRLDMPTPVFSSPVSKTYLTGGCWSPTRPGVLFLSKGDGDVDVWDFTDSSYHPSVTAQTAPNRITSMEFLPPPPAAAAGTPLDKAPPLGKQQLLAVGDAHGNLHVFEMPRNLWRPVPNELGLMEAFLRREITKVGYVVQRFEQRAAEDGGAEGRGLGDEPEPEEEAGGDAAGDAATRAGTAPGGGGGGAAEGGGEGEGDEEEVLEPELLEQDKEYAELMEKFVEQIELGPEDLSEAYLAAQAAGEAEEDAEAAMNATARTMNSTVRSQKSQGRLGTAKSQGSLKP